MFANSPPLYFFLLCPRSASDLMEFFKRCLVRRGYNYPFPPFSSPRGFCLTLIFDRSLQFCTTPASVPSLFPPLSGLASAHSELCSPSVLGRPFFSGMLLTIPNVLFNLCPPPSNPLRFLSVCFYVQCPCPVSPATFFSRPIGSSDNHFRVTNLLLFLDDLNTPCSFPLRWNPLVEGLVTVANQDSVCFMGALRPGFFHVPPFACVQRSPLCCFQIWR